MGKRARGVREREGGEGRGGEGRGGEGIEVAIKVQKGYFASKSDARSRSDWKFCKNWSSKVKKTVVVTSSTNSRNDILSWVKWQS